MYVFRQYGTKQLRNLVVRVPSLWNGCEGLNRRRSDWNSGGMHGGTYKSCCRSKNTFSYIVNASNLVLKILQHDKIWGDNPPAPNSPPVIYAHECLRLLTVSLSRRSANLLTGWLLWHRSRCRLARRCQRVTRATAATTVYWTSRCIRWSRTGTGPRVCVVTTTATRTTIWRRGIQRRSTTETNLWHSPPATCTTSISLITQ